MQQVDMMMNPSLTPDQVTIKIAERLKRLNLTDLELSQDQQNKLDRIRNSQMQQQDLSYEIGGTLNQF